MASSSKVNRKNGARSRPFMPIVKSLDASPPQHDSSLSFTKKFRFRCTTACVDSAFTQVQLLDLVACITTANTTAHRLISAARVKKVSIWAVPFSSAATSQGNATVSVEFSNLGVAGSFGSPPRKFSDTSQSPTDYAHIAARPDPQSLAGSWFNDDGTSPVFLLVCPIGAIVDITLDLVLRNGETPVACAVAPTGAAGLVGIETMTSASATAGVLISADYQVL